MAKETRKNVQFKVYTLFAHYTSKDDIVYHIPVGVFDDKDLLNEYLKDAKETETENNKYTTGEQWVEIMPVMGNFSLPFNPKFDLDAFKAELRKRLPKRVKSSVVAKSNSVVKQLSTDQEAIVNKDVEALKGLKITKKSKE